MDRVIRDIEKQVAGIDEIDKWTATIKANSDRILGRTKRMREALRANVDTLDERIAQIQALDD